MVLINKEDHDKKLNTLQIIVSYLTEMFFTILILVKVSTKLHNW